MTERFLLLNSPPPPQQQKKPIYEPGNIFRCSELIKSFPSNEVFLEQHDEVKITHFHDNDIEMH